MLDYIVRVLYYYGSNEHLKKEQYLHCNYDHDNWLTGAHGDKISDKWIDTIKNKLVHV